MPSLKAITLTAHNHRARQTSRARTLALTSFLLAGFLISSLLISPHSTAAAEQPARPAPTLTAEHWVLLQFKSFYGHGMRKGPEGISFRLERISDKYVEHFNQLDYGESGIRPEDEEIYLNEEARNYTASRLASFHQKDKNGDLKVTREELLIHNHKSANQLIRIGKMMLLPSETQSSLALSELLSRDLAEDLDQDGVITMQEVINSPMLKKSIENRWRGIEKNLLPRDFDSNQDSTITLEEYQQKLTPILNRLDRDQNGEISQDEKHAYDEGMRRVYKEMRQLKRK